MSDNSSTARRLVSKLATTDWVELEREAGIKTQALEFRGCSHTRADYRLPLPLAAEDAAPSPEQLIDRGIIDAVAARAERRVLSLDIWDTLLRRDCHPDETKLRAARAVWLRCSPGTVALRSFHPIDVFETRRLAEAAVADACHEYSFINVAREWARLLNLTSLDVPAIIEIEEAVEREATFADATMTQVVDAWPGRKICISDFYLSADSLRILLKQNGFATIDAVYVSSDIMKTKRDGTLFDHVLAAEKLSADDVLHVGDNRVADVDSAEARGIDTLHYESAGHLARSRRFGERFRQHLSGDSSGHDAALLGLALGVRQAAAGRGAFDNGVPVEALAIPALGMALHVLEEALKRGFNDVFFLTREGIFLNRLHDAVTGFDVFGLRTYPRGRILEVSRRATFAASLGDFTISELMRLWSQYSSQSLHALALTLNADPDLMTAAAARHGIAMDEIIRYPWQDARVKALFLDPYMKAAAMAHLSAQRADLLGYLSEAGFLDRDNSARARMIVDVGWRGTIQDNLAHVVGGHIHGAYFGLDKYLNTQPANTTKAAFLMDRNVDPSFRLSEYAAFEFLFNATGGTVTGYRESKALREIIPGEERVITRDVEGFQKRLLETLPPLADYVRRHGLVSSDLRRVSQAITRAYMAHPASDLATAFVGLEHNETFGTGQTDMLSGEHDESPEDLGSATTAEIHGYLTRRIAGLRWPQAHGCAPGLRRFLVTLAPVQRLAIPLSYRAAPAVIDATRLGTPSIVFLSPAPLAGSGGHRTIYNFAQRLAQIGYDVELRHEAPGSAHAMAWAETIFQESDVRQVTGWTSRTTAVSAAVSTVAHSAAALHDIFPSEVQKFYFVQDHEADFNPVGDGYLAAQQSYAQGHSHITIGRWLAHLLRNRYGKGAVSAGLGVDASVYRLKAESISKDRKQQIAFLYQPEKFRRAPALCIAALGLVKKSMPEVEILVYGSDARLELPFDVTNYGLIDNLSAINDMYNSTRAGLCLSSTNPSRIPFEMMAAGCVPVDLYRYNNLFDYKDGCGVLAYQSPASVAAALLRVLSDDDFYADHAEAGLAYAKDRTLDWEMDVAANAVAYGLSGGDFDGLDIPEIAYTSAPFMASECDTPTARAFLDWQVRTAKARP